MIIFLIVCSQVYGGYSCLPAQRMPSAQVCDFVARRYRSAAGGYISTQCLTIRSPK